MKEFIRKTSEELPREDQDVLYWLHPFEKWFIGKFDGEWTFYSKLGFCDGHDAPYWCPVEALPDPRIVFEDDNTLDDK